MKSRSLLKFACAALPVFGLTALTAAQGPGEPPARGLSMIEHLAERLELSDTEADELARIMREHRAAVAPTMDGLRRARQALREQISSEIFDAAAIRERAAEVAELEADVAVERARHGQALRGLLSPEQFKTFQEMRERRQRGPGGPWGPGRHRGGQRHER